MQFPNMPAPPAPPPMPTCSNCVTTTQLAKEGAIPNQVPSSILRSSTGQMRVDFPNTSVITNPAGGYAIMLNHLKQEAHVVPIPQAPQMPQMPGMGAMPGMPSSLSHVKVEDLGMGMVEGVEVMGKRYTMNPPGMPKMPSMPQEPAMPQAPGMPQMPAMPKPPAMPPLVSEIWSSTKLKMPVLTTVTGAFGQTTCYCKHAALGEPPATAFQIPPNYTQVQPPAMPKAPAMPKLPG
ncbi:MAG TPA: hypothetical protein VG168_03025 [Bryobacteraceae bacterium]|jgi:hypothetical protein|nr:hypothetical protein [Bryobacteraceae bacterium]